MGMLWGMLGTGFICFGSYIALEQAGYIKPNPPDQLLPDFYLVETAVILLGYYCISWAVKCMDTSLTIDDQTIIYKRPTGDTVSITISDISSAINVTNYYSRAFAQEGLMLRYKTDMVGKTKSERLAWPWYSKIRTIQELLKQRSKSLVIGNMGVLEYGEFKNGYKDRNISVGAGLLICLFIILSITIALVIYCHYDLLR